MSNESMNLGESFQAVKVGAAEPTKTVHRVTGWGVVLALIASLGYCDYRQHRDDGQVLQERPGLDESLSAAPKKMGGVLQLDVVRDGVVVASLGPIHNTIVNAGETALRDCFGGTGTPTCTAVQNFKFHGLGTSSTAIAEADTGCGTELTTQYQTDNTRATGSQTNNGANIYRTVGTNTVDATVTVQEFCLMSQAATGGGTMWTRILTGGIALVSGDSVQTTYDLTIE